MDLNLKGKTAIVTGGSQGLGEAVCRCFAKEGVNVVVNYRSSEDKALALSKELKQSFGVAALPIKADISIEKDVKDMFNAVKEEIGIPDILVNNSGVCPVTMIKDTSLGEWNMVMATNLTGTFLTNREMVNTLLDNSKEGSIVNIISSASFIGSKRGKTAYSASKGGVLTFTHSLAREVSRFGIRVNSVAPGIMYTQMTAGILKDEEEKYNETVPIGRVATVEEVANMVVMTASDAAAYMTGAVIDASGGLIPR